MEAAKTKLSFAGTKRRPTILGLGKGINNNTSLSINKLSLICFHLELSSARACQELHTGNTRMNTRKSKCGISEEGLALA